ncbi:MAG: sugar transferase [Ignavibacteriae bacterium]|nr:sugar transferase [Ignavibacteriota bacterium]
MNINTINIDNIIKDENINSSSIKISFWSRLSSPYIQFFIDIISLILSFLSFYFVLFESGLFSLSFKPEFTDNITIIICLQIYWFILFWLTGLYKDWYIRSPFDEFFSILRTAFIGTFIIFFFIFLDSSKSPRLSFLIYFTLFITFVGTGRLISRNLQKKLRKNRIIIIPALIIGTSKEVKELYDKTLIAKAWGYQPIGIVLQNESEIIKWKEISKNEIDNSNILGIIDKLPEIISLTNPKEILIAVNNQEHQLLLKITSICAEKKVSIKIVPDLYDYFTGQARTLHLYGIPLIEVSTQLLKPWQSITKRIIDIIFSTLVIIIGLPIWLLIGIIIKLESKGPIFYLQERAGKEDKSFLIYKFRSMVENAEENGPGWTAVNDARVTKFGRFIRRAHLDEVPQFINVLKGEMSVVGPRPELSKLVDKFTIYVPYYKRRLVVRPGITGWWQVKYTSYEESKEEIENRLKDDFYYIENMSLRLDFEILIRTIFLMIKGHGQA